MKNLKMTLVVMFVAVFAHTVKAQDNVGQALSGLINVNVNVGDITINDVIDVEDVLNDNEVRILNNVLNNSPIASNNSDILTNLLRDAEILNDNQVVVGILSGVILVDEL